MHTSRPVLLALKPRFADGILSGRKTVELRRGRTTFQPGQRVLIYTSSPTMAVLGEFLVESVTYGEPEDLWPAVRNQACVSADEFTAYYDGAASATAIMVSSPQRWARPVPLAELRDRIVGFVAPQSYRYLTEEQAHLLWRAAHRRVGNEAVTRLAAAI